MKNLEVDVNRVALARLSHEPVNCPIGSCEYPHSPLELLAHVLERHLPQPEVQDQLRVVYSEERSVLVFDPAKLPPNRSICLGVLLYGGIRNKPETLPARSGLCFANRLPTGPSILASYVYKEHMPVLLLAQQSSSFLPWLHDPRLKLMLRQSSSPSPSPPSWLIWTQSASSTRPLYATLTAYNQSMNESRGVIRRVGWSSRAISAALAEFSSEEQAQLPDSSHCLWLTQSDMNELYDRQTKCIQLEVILHESPSLRQGQDSVQRSLLRFQ